MEAHYVIVEGKLVATATSLRAAKDYVAENGLKGAEIRVLKSHPFGSPIEAWLLAATEKVAP